MRVDLQQVNYSNFILESGRGKACHFDIPENSFADTHPKTVMIDGTPLYLRDNFHICILHDRHRELFCSLLKDPQKLKQFDTICNRYNWYYEPTDEYYLIANDKDFNPSRTTIIQMIHIPMLAQFYANIESTFGISLGAPVPTHITLYCKDHHKGIFIRSTKELDKYRIQIIPKQSLIEI